MSKKTTFIINNDYRGHRFNIEILNGSICIDIINNADKLIRYQTMITQENIASLTNSMFKSTHELFDIFQMNFFKTGSCVLVNINTKNKSIIIKILDPLKNNECNINIIRQSVSLQEQMNGLMSMFENFKLEMIDNAVPIGSIIAFGGTNIPINWMICDGRSLNKNEHIKLFSVIGTTFGSGNGIETFNIPDCRGRCIIGAGLGNNLSDRVLGQVGGEETHILTVEEMPKHSHGVTGSAGKPVSGFSGIIYTMHRPSEENDPGYEGNNLPHDIMQPYITMNYIIKV
jgi:microcystin-dependent protein